MTSSVADRTPMARTSGASTAAGTDDGETASTLNARTLTRSDRLKAAASTVLD
jgi:hypothetical protein